MLRVYENLKPVKHLYNIDNLQKILDYLDVKIRVEQTNNKIYVIDDSKGYDDELFIYTGREDYIKYIKWLTMLEEEMINKSKERRERR